MGQRFGYKFGNVDISCIDNFGTLPYPNSKTFCVMADSFSSPLTFELSETLMKKVQRYLRSGDYHYSYSDAVRFAIDTVKVSKRQFASEPMHQLSVRISQAQRNRLATEAKRVGVSLGEYLRVMLQDLPDSPPEAFLTQTKRRRRMAKKATSSKVAKKAAKKAVKKVVAKKAVKKAVAKKAVAKKAVKKAVAKKAAVKKAAVKKAAVKKVAAKKAAAKKAPAKKVVAKKAAAKKAVKKAVKKVAKRATKKTN